MLGMSAAPQGKDTPDIFHAVWPVEDLGMPATELFEEARGDLRNVAVRHRARITGEPRFEVRTGKGVPGNQGAAFVVTCTVDAEPIGRRDYGQPHPLGAVA